MRVAFTVVICGLAHQLLTNPAGYVATSPAAGPGRQARRQSQPGPGGNRDAARYWVAVGNLFHRLRRGVDGDQQRERRHGERNDGFALAFVAVAVMAVGNAGGRICAGLLSDRIGRAAGH